MRSARAISLKSRFSQVLWVGNATISAAFAVLGGRMLFAASGHDMLLSAMAARSGAVLAVTGATLAVYSLWRARSSR